MDNHKIIRVSDGSAQLMAIAVIAFASLFVSAYFNQLYSQVPAVEARFKNRDGSVSRPYQLRLALTEKQRAKGLMFVNQLNPKEGMLFAFPREEQQLFWMKNTYISLDMIFLDRSLCTVGILSDVPILNEEPRKIEQPSKYVVELLAGSAAKAGITQGSCLQLKRPLPEVVS
jgi:uncharacterized membrane protein (UPF0127 family)